ncbi:MULTISPECIES: LysR family transcriptional regulator [Agrobacterium]|nr:MULTISPECIES: LysR family transcriptional regulator [Agrobacterium]
MFVIDFTIREVRRMRGTDFGNLRAFMMIVDSGSFVRAAAALKIAPSTLSYTIQVLEGRLGTKLLQRTTRTVRLTEAGSRLARRLGPMMSEFDTLMEDLTEPREKPSGTLKLCVPRMPMRLYMEPLLNGFEAAYTDITIDLTIGDVLVDIAVSGFDAAVIPNRSIQDDLVSIRLGPELKRIVYASPRYLARFGAPSEPGDLVHHNCINFRGPHTGAIYPWEFQRGQERFEVAVSGSLIVSDSTYTLSAALSGKGIGYGIEPISKPFLDDGSLISLLEGWVAPHPGFMLCYPKNRNISAALKALLSYVRKQSRAGSRLNDDRVNGRLGSTHIVRT